MCQKAVDLDALREQFRKTAREYVKRDGVESLLEWLDTTDFYTAPASTRYHSMFPGGLCLHSLNVFKRLMSRDETGEDFNDESKALVSLFHDMCKVNFYTIDYKNQKNSCGVWERVPYYTCNDTFPLGHGEKSLYLVQKHMRLTDSEALAIRWHMGNFGIVPGTNECFALTKARRSSKLVFMLHEADTEAAFWDENE